MAEHLAAKHFPNCSFSSAGTRATPGEPASAHALAVMAARGIDMSAHRSRLLSPEQGEDVDRIVCMTAAHRDLIARSFPGLAPKLKVLRQYATLLPEDLADPYGGSRADYERCAAQIEEALSRLPLAKTGKTVEEFISNKVK